MALVSGWILAGRRMQIVKTAKPRAGLIEPLDFWGVGGITKPDIRVHLLDDALSSNT